MEQVVKDLELEYNNLLNAKPGKRRKVLHLLDRYLDVFCDEDRQYGNTTQEEFQVKLKPGARPVRAPMRPHNPDQKASLKRQLDCWYTEGVIKTLTSLWGNPLVPDKR